MKRNLLLFLALYLMVTLNVNAGDYRTDSLSMNKVNVVDFKSQFNDCPTASIEDVLTGRVSGLQIQKWSGSPGVQSLISIRNAGILNEVNTPLVILNGVPIFQDPTEYTNTNPLATIALEEVASVEILKDANSLALYGARGANGVILITTKKGQGKDELNINVAGGLNFVGDNLESPVSGDTERYRVKDLYDKGNLLYPERNVEYPSVVNDSLNNFYRLSNDWQSEHFDRRPVVATDMTLQGSGKYGYYRLNLGLMNDQGVKDDNSFRRYNFGLNTRYNITKQFAFDFYMSAVQADRGISLSNFFEPSYYPYADDTNFFPELTFDSDNALLNENSNKHISINAGLDFKISDRLKLYSLFGIVSESVKSNLFIPSTLNNGAIQSFAGSAKRQRLSNTTMLSYIHSKLEFDLGLEYINSHSETIDIKGERKGSGFSDFVKTVASAYSRDDVSGGSDKYSDVLVSVFADSKFNVSNNLQVLATIRLDGTSAYQENQWCVFPALGANWFLVKESDATVFKNLMLKANVGRSGNIRTTDQLYLGSMISQGSYVNTEGPVSVYPYNPELTYSKTKQADLGVEASIGQTTHIAVDAFMKNTDNYLYQVTMPSFSGYEYRYANGVEVKTSGIELTLNSKLFDGDFSWYTGITASAIKSEVMKLPDDIHNSSLSYLKKGSSLSAIYAFEADGYYKMDGSDVGASDRYSNTSFQAGTPKIIDHNQDGQITDADKVKIADRQPTLFGGVTNLFSYKKFYLDTHFSYGLGAEIVHESQTERYANDAYLHGLFEVEEGKMNYYQLHRNGSGANDLAIQGISSIEDVSFLRLEKISLGYEFKSTRIAGLNIKGARLFVTGTNLFVASNYKKDPEANFNGVRQFDLATSGTPRYKTILVGLRVKL